MREKRTFSCLAIGTLARTVSFLLYLALFQDFSWGWLYFKEIKYLIKNGHFLSEEIPENIKENTDMKIVVEDSAVHGRC